MSQTIPEAVPDTGPSSEELARRDATMSPEMLAEAAKRAQALIDLRGMSDAATDALHDRQEAHQEQLAKIGKPGPLGSTSFVGKNDRQTRSMHGKASRLDKKHYRGQHKIFLDRHNIDTVHKELAVEEAAQLHPDAFKSPPVTDK